MTKSSPLTAAPARGQTNRALPENQSLPHKGRAEDRRPPHRAKPPRWARPITTTALLLSASILCACGGQTTVSRDQAQAIIENYSDYLDANAVEYLAAQPLHLEGIAGLGSLIAIIDTGIMADHVDLAGQISSKSYVASDAGSLDDTHGHGTSIAGLIAAAANNEGIVGIAPQAQIMAVKVEQSTGVIYNSTVANGIEGAASKGADVINLSLSNIASNTYNEIQTASDLGAVIVIASGNSGPSSAPTGAAFDIDQFAGGITVTALAENGKIASYATPCAIAVAKYCVAAPGTNLLTTAIDGGYDTFSGTSAATAVVSGAMGLLKGYFPDLTNEELVQILITTTDDLGAAGIDQVYGSGAINLERALQPIGTLQLAEFDSRADVTTSAMTISGTATVSAALLASLDDIAVSDAYARDYTVDLGALVDTVTRPPLEVFSYQEVSAPLPMLATGLLEMNFIQEHAFADNAANTAGLAIALGATPDLVINSYFGPNETELTGGPKSTLHYFAPDQNISSIGANWTLGSGTAIQADLYISEDRNRMASAIGLRQELGAGFYAGLEAAGIREEGGVLGTEITGAFGEIGTSETVATTLRTGYKGAKFTLDLALTQGQTQTGLASTGLVTEITPMKAEAAELTLSYDGLFDPSDIFALSLSAPLSITQGAMVVAGQEISLVPSARPIELAMRYETEIGEMAALSAGLKLRPTGDDAAPLETALGLQYALKF